jgi:hypothetical protein
MVDLHELEPLDVPQPDVPPVILDRNRVARTWEHQPDTRDLMVKPAEPCRGPRPPSKGLAPSEDFDQSVCLMPRRSIRSRAKRTRGCALVGQRCRGGRYRNVRLRFYPVMALIIGANYLRASKAFLAKLNNIGARLTL